MDNSFGTHIVTFDIRGIPLIGNTSNGAIVGLTPLGKEICEKLCNGSLSKAEAYKLDPELLNYLDTAGFFNRDIHEKKLQVVYLHITHHCNLHCLGCYSYEENRNHARDLSTEQMFSIIQKVSKSSIKSLFISGGEPFLRNDLVPIVQYANNCGISNIAIITNGTCLTQNVLKKIAPYVGTICVSIDGISPVSPSYIRGEQRYNMLIKSIHAIQDAGINAHIIPTIHRKNIDDLAEYIAMAKRLDTTLNFSIFSGDCCNDGLLSSLIHDNDSLLQLAEFLINESISLGSLKEPFGVNLSIRQNCGAASREISIAADGSVYPCHMLHKPDFLMGNLLTQDLIEILNSRIGLMFDSLDRTKIDHCIECDYRLVCGGGCVARSIYSSGKLNDKDPYCFLMKHFFEGLSNRLMETTNH